MKKIILTILSLMFIVTSCSKGSSSTSASKFNVSKNIDVISREDGSGTRAAFIELFELLSKDSNGQKDLTSKEAIIAKQNDMVIGNIVRDVYAIGYISLGSLSSELKAVAIENVVPTQAAVVDKSYKVTRPFNIAVTKKPISDLAEDFIAFILSYEGQEVIGKSYVPVINDAPHYEAKGIEGRLVVAGSSSVTPAMEKLREAYLAINPQVVLEIQQSDSSSGLQSAIDGTCDIAMASRELKASEEEVLLPTTIAIDAIALVVNLDNPLENLSIEQVRSIYTGETTSWSEIIESPTT